VRSAIAAGAGSLPHARRPATQSSSSLASSASSFFAFALQRKSMPFAFESLIQKRRILRKVA
jgi:hypothetical protein